MGTEIKRGQLATGRKSLSDSTGISEQSLRTCITRLKSTSEITIVSTSLFSIITVCNYDSYQSNEIEINQPVNQQINFPSTSDQPAINHKQECKNDKNDKKIQYSIDFSGYRIAFKLWQSIKKSGTIQKKPELSEWGEEIRKIHDIDKKPWDIIYQVMLSARDDSFWIKNLRSAKSLRKNILNGNFDKFIPQEYLTDSEFEQKVKEAVDKENQENQNAA